MDVKEMPILFISLFSSMLTALMRGNGNFKEVGIDFDQIKYIGGEASVRNFAKIEPG